MTATIYMDSWAVTPHYRLIRELGRGGYGHVCEAVHCISGTHVAIKRFEHIFRDSLDAKRAIREICILPQLTSRYVVKMREILPMSRGGEDLYAVMELAESDLRKVIRSDVVLHPGHVQMIMYRALCGLKYIHSAGVIHRDLKPGNILINSDCSVLLCDFGLAREPISPSQTLTKHVSTRWYRSPELILLENDYSTPVDIWSLGCVFGELLGKLPGGRRQGPLFPGKSCYPLSPARRLGMLPVEVLEVQDQLAVILEVIGTPNDLEFISNTAKRQYVQNFPSKPRIDFTSWYPSASVPALDLLNSMLQFNPSARITVDQALSHPYFHSIRDSSVEETSFHIVNLPFDSSAELQISELREILHREVEKYQGKNASRWSLDAHPCRFYFPQGSRSC